MLTVGEVAANVIEWFFINGHPHAHTFLEHVMDRMETDGLDKEQPLRYQGDKPAYCKYCYTNHSKWHISNDHFPPCWICERCDHAMSDEYMEIEE